MRILRFFLLVPLAIAFAIAGAAMFLFFGGLTEPAGQRLVIGLTEALFDAFEQALAYDALPDFPMPLAWGLWRASLAILVAPVACVGIAGEVFRVRSYIYHAALTGLVTAMMPWAARTRLDGGAGAGGMPVDAAEIRLTALLFLTGCVAGTIYWMIAGRSAGPERVPERLPDAR